MCLFEPLEKSYWLAKLCEANFERLLRLIPGLTDLAESSIARAEGKPSLHLKLLDQSTYTLTLELSHCFSKGFESLLEPAVKIRVYLDARAAEVLSEHARIQVNEASRHMGMHKAVLDYKWSLNYFLSQWLDHCLASDYRFGLSRSELESCVEQA